MGSPQDISSSRPVRYQRPLPESIADAINHEFRTPLASLIGHLELIIDRADELPDEVVASLEAMDRAGHRLRELVNAYALIAEASELV